MNVTDPMHQIMRDAIQRIASELGVRVEDIRCTWIDVSSNAENSFILADLHIGSRS